MAVKIRLKRMGKIRTAIYRVVVMDSRTKRDGRAIEEIGRYDPNQEPSLIEIDIDRANYWRAQGAQPTAAVAALLKPYLEGTLKVKEPKVSKKELYEAAIAAAGGSDLEDSSGATTASKKKASKKTESASSEADTATDAGSDSQADAKAGKTDAKPKKSDAQAEKTGAKSDNADSVKKSAKSEARADTADAVKKSEKSEARADTADAEKKPGAKAEKSEARADTADSVKKSEKSEARADTADAVKKPEAKSEARADTADAEKKPEAKSEKSGGEADVDQGDDTTPATFADLPEGSAAATKDGTAPKGYAIKGNRDSMKYHEPDGRWYEQTVAEVWFKTAADAEAAGFVKAGS